MFRKVPVSIYFYKPSKNICLMTQSLLNYYTFFSLLLFSFDSKAPAALTLTMFLLTSHFAYK
jgi:hypothetical protein